MNILVLHNVEDLGRARRSTLDYIFAFERYQPEHTYHYQRITDPPPDEVRSAHWDAVIFESTSVAIVTIRPRELYFQIRDQWGFLKREETIKVAFPQDDANCGGLMDDWFSDWGFQYIFSVRAPEHWPVVYPRSYKSARFLPCLSGYIDDRSLPDLQKHAKPWPNRGRLIGQRVTMYPARGGRQGRLKGVIAEAVKAAALKRGLKADISTDPSDTFFGDRWYSFLGDCKYVLGTEGGLSVNDPYGLIADRIAEFQAENPEASFEQIEKACFPGLDGVHVFSGFSPRILEAAVCRSSQILVEGHYLGAIEPDTHYLCLKQDLSNVDAVLDALVDETAAQRRIKACDEALVDNMDFRFSTLAARVIATISENLSGRSESVAFDSRNAQRGYIKALEQKAREEGFRWPELGDRVADQCARQQLPGDIRGSLTSGAAAAAKTHVLVSEIRRMAQVAADGSLAAIFVETLGGIAGGLARMLESMPEGPLPEGLEGGLEQVVAAFDALNFDPEAFSTPGSVAPVMFILGSKGDYEAIESAAALKSGGDMARLVRALGGSEAALLGLANRLAPKSSGQFSESEIHELRQLDELLVRTLEAGLDYPLRHLNLGERGQRMLAALEDGGDISRLILAFGNKEHFARLSGIASRLAPQSGLEFSTEELEKLTRLDELLVRTSETGLDSVLRHLDLGERGQRMLNTLETGGDVSRLMLALANRLQAVALAGIVSRLAPRSGDKFAPEEVAALQELDRFLVLAGGRPFETFQPQSTDPPGTDKVRAAAEVLDWPSDSLALLVIEVLSLAGTDKAAAEEYIETFGHLIAAGPTKSALIGWILGRNSERND